MRKHTRSDRVGQLIQTALAKIIQQEMQEHRLSLVTLLDVRVTRDFAHAKVFISVLSDDKSNIKEIVTLLNQSAKFLRFRLAQEVLLRNTPELTFIYDDAVAQGSRLSSMINALTRDDPSHD